MLADSLQNKKSLYLLSKSNSRHVGELGKYIFSLIQKYKDEIKKNNRLISCLSDNPSKDKANEFQDQGFTRPIVLVLAPFRNSAYEIINAIIASSSVQMIQSKKRFEADFGPDQPEPSEDVDDGDKCDILSEGTHSDHSMDDESHSSESDGESDIETERPKTAAVAAPQSPFRGNIDDCFRLGVRIGAKSISLYEKFYSSDLVIASPLSLRMLIGSKGDTSKKHDHDYLSSIRLLVILEAEVINFQNWDHLLHVVDHVNLLPKKNTFCDFSRVHPLLLDGKGAQLRQNLVCASFPTPEINALWRHLLSACGTEGQVLSTCTEVDAATQDFLVPRPALLSFYPEDVNPIDHFEEEVLAYFSRADQMTGICVYVPSYLDFVQLLARLEERRDISFRAISEYSTSNEIVGARSSFFNRHVRLLLVSERLLYFKRLVLRGIETLVFFGPPTDPSLYDLLVSRSIPIDNQESNSKVYLYNSLPQDLLALERIFGPGPIAAHYQSNTVPILTARICA